MNKCNQWDHDFEHQGAVKLVDLACAKCGLPITQWVKEMKDSIEEEAGMDIVSLIVNATRSGIDDICNCGEPYMIEDGKKYCPNCDVTGDNDA